MDDTKNELADIVRSMEQDYKSGVTNISKYVTHDLNETVNKIDAYLNSKHISGSTDSQGRDKPFFNIVTAAVNIWFRATDIDRKHIKIKPTKSKDTIDAFLATVIIQDWMRRESFGQFLNEWGRVLARYGSAVVKFVEKDGELHSSVVPWQRLIVDSVDFDNNIKIEVLDLSEAELRRREGYDQNIVKKLCKAKRSRQTLDGTTKDNKNDYIRLYEVHGEMPLSFLTGNEDDKDTYVQQMHVISYLASKEKGKFDDFTLVSGREKNPYLITHLIREEGRTLSIGSVEHLFEAQWMMNHTAKAIKDQLDLASKLIFQTSDGTFVGQNALTAIQNGDILIHAPNQPLTELNNTSHDITALQNQGNMWKMLSSEIVGISESMMGNAAPSGTAWRQVEALLQESHSLFELMTENKGLHIVEMFTEFIIPFVKTKLDTSEEVSAVLDDYDLKKIDTIFIKNVATKAVNDKIIDSVLNDEEITPLMQGVMQTQAETKMQDELTKLGNMRFFKPSDIDSKTWKEVLKDLEWELEVDITGEATDTQTAMTTANTFLQFLARKAGQPITPDEKFFLSKILSLTGMASPMEISALATSPSQPSQPIASPVGQDQPVQVGAV